jgi:hypothetical protein
MGFVALLRTRLDGWTGLAEVQSSLDLGARHPL